VDSFFLKKKNVNKKNKQKMEPVQTRLDACIDYEYSTYAPSDEEHRGMITIKVPEDHSLRGTPEIVFVVDISGSMMQSLHIVKAVIEYTLERFIDQARCAVVGFSDTATIFQQMTPITCKSQDQIMRNIDALVGFGNTNLSEGLLTGLQLFTPEHFPRYLFLITDGLANLGMLEDEQIKEAALGLRANAQLYALSIGPDYNYTLLSKLAEITGGCCHNVQNMDSIAESMGGMLGSIYGTVVNECKVIFKETVVNLSGRRESTSESGETCVEVGSLLGGETVHIPFLATGEETLVRVCFLDEKMQPVQDVQLTSLVPKNKDDPILNISVFVQILRVEVAQLLLGTPSAVTLRSYLALCEDEAFSTEPIVALLQRRLEAMMNSSCHNLHEFASELIKQRSHLFDENENPLVPPLVRSFSSGAKSHCTPETSHLSFSIPLHPLALKRC
jgi:Mg-chelatase subunit ChlD